MPNPREAIYDVLIAKRRRRKEERLKLQAYVEWNHENQVARSAAALKAKKR